MRQRFRALCLSVLMLVLFLPAAGAQTNRFDYGLADTDGFGQPREWLAYVSFFQIGSMSVARAFPYVGIRRDEMPLLVLLRDGTMIWSHDWRDTSVWPEARPKTRPETLPWWIGKTDPARFVEWKARLSREAVFTKPEEKHRWVYGEFGIHVTIGFSLNGQQRVLRLDDHASLRKTFELLLALRPRHSRPYLPDRIALFAQKVSETPARTRDLEKEIVLWPLEAREVKGPRIVGEAGPVYYSGEEARRLQRVLSRSADRNAAIVRHANGGLYHVWWTPVWDALRLESSVVFWNSIPSSERTERLRQAIRGNQLLNAVLRGDSARVTRLLTEEPGLLAAVNLPPTSQLATTYYSPDEDTVELPTLLEIARWREDEEMVRLLSERANKPE